MTDRIQEMPKQKETEHQEGDDRLLRGLCKQLNVWQSWKKRRFSLCCGIDAVTHFASLDVLVTDVNSAAIGGLFINLNCFNHLSVLQINKRIVIKG